MPRLGLPRARFCTNVDAALDLPSWRDGSPALYPTNSQDVTNFIVLVREESFLGNKVARLELEHEKIILSIAECSVICDVIFVTIFRSLAWLALVRVPHRPTMYVGTYPSEDVTCSEAISQRNLSISRITRCFFFVVSSPSSARCIRCLRSSVPF